MKERPILFSAPMVRALLEGRKTQTRRLVKPQPTKHPDPCRGDVGFEWPSSKAQSMVDVRDMGGLSPYGVPGDRLWVKETHTFTGWDEGGLVDVTYPADGERASMLARVDEFDAWVEKRVRQMKRSGAVVVGDVVQMPEGVPTPSTPSIFMQRWVSRILLEVTDVRVERLLDISEADARAEGVGAGPPNPSPEWWPGKSDPDVWWTARDSFRLLWESINGAESWSASPWVWVVGFKVVEVRR